MTKWGLILFFFLICLDVLLFFVYLRGKIVINLKQNEYGKI